MFSSDDLYAALGEIDQAIHNHEQWFRELTRSLVCRLPHDQRDLAADAHQHCRLGQWYYGPSGQRYRGNAAFEALELEHERMHHLAAQLLEAAAHRATITSDEYDAFANALDRLRLQLHTMRQELENSLYQRDPLTGAEGRVGMLTRLRETLELVRRGVQPCTIAVMDLDHFKAINDAHGHLVGDQVLVGAVVHIRDHLRAYDRVFRYGGEEFLLLLANAELPSATSVVERIREGLTSRALAHDAGREVFVTASFGMASLDPDVSIEESIERADKALYAAKAAGRNCVRHWTPPDSE